MTAFELYHTFEVVGACVTLITHVKKKNPACLLWDFISVDLQKRSVTYASPAEFCCGCVTLINFVPPQKKYQHFEQQLNKAAFCRCTNAGNSC